MSTDLAVSWARAQLAPWMCDAAIPADGACRDVVADWAESGVVALTGRADGPPMIPPGAAATAARGAQLAFAALTGRCDPTLETFGWHRLLGERAALAGFSRRAPWSPGGACHAVPAADGWVAVSLARPDDIAVLPALMESGEVVAAAVAWPRLAEWARGHSADYFVERGRLLGLPCGAVPAPGQWCARRPLRPGVADFPVRVIEVEPASPACQTAGPLVVDLSALWAGPLCASLLGGVGARVVKVESASRLDGARRGAARFYDLLHAGQESVVIDLEQPSDRLLLQRLLDQADIVVESSRPRAMASLGVDPLEVCRRTPTTWVAITAYGRTCGDRVGFGDDVAMAAGLAARETGQDRPLPCGDAIADPLTGMHAAVAAMASWRKGGSRLLDVAMCDVVAATIAWAPSASVAAEPAGGGWILRGGTGRWPVASPQSRPGRAGQAAAPGRDTSIWRSQ